MVRLADLPDWDRENLLKKVPSLSQFSGRPWARGPALSQRRVAIVTTAGLHVRSDRPFGAGAAGMDYRVIPGDVARADVIMSRFRLISIEAGSRRTGTSSFRSTV